ncbi:MAG: hypothetical protein ACXAC5_03395 [Promethearchaeota archaeon]|jgi:hypothetical protein
MIVDTTRTKTEHQLDDTRPLSDYSDADKVKWFNEFYESAEEYAEEKIEYNRKVYESMFINAARDILKRKKPFRIYEFQGIVVVNEYALNAFSRRGG